MPSVVMELPLFFLLSLSLLCIINSASGETDQEKAMAVISGCKQKTGATEDFAEIMTKQIIPSTTEGQCMLQCILEAKGLMKDEKAFPEEFKSYFEKKYDSDLAKKETALKAVAECTPLIKGLKESDKCKVAAKVFQCAYDHQVRLT